MGRFFKRAKAGGNMAKGIARQMHLCTWLP
jgi:hypothetical protein